MAFCIACAEWSTERPLCGPCRLDLAMATPPRSRSGLLVAAALRHRGAARRLVHRLKYQGLLEAASVLGGFMAPLVPPGAHALVPVPRARLRRARFGVDPAQALAEATASITGVPVTPLLRAAIWWPRHASRPRRGRGPPGFRRAGAPVGITVLIDDVATSGSTLEAARAVLGEDVRHGVVATAPGRMRMPAPAEAGEVASR